MLLLESCGVKTMLGFAWGEKNGLVVNAKTLQLVETVQFRH